MALPIPRLRSFAAFLFCLTFGIIDELSTEYDYEDDETWCGLFGKGDE